MFIHKIIEHRPGDVLQKPMQYAIVVTHGVDPFSCPETPASARNRVESTPCNPSTKTQPDSRGTNPDVRADEALALAHVRKLKGFYMHLTQYVAVIGLLAVVNLLTYPHYLWFAWAAFGWGIGVAAHAFDVFGHTPFLNAAWERRQVEKYLGREL